MPHHSSLLQEVRIIDLADDAGAFAGTLLADLGATVVKPEPPGGAPSRRLGPFLERPDREPLSLFHRHYHGAKQIVEAASDDPAALDDLLAGADILIDDGSTGFVSGDADAITRLTEAHPRLSIVRISPYGLSGPRAGWRSTDLTAWAAGGAMWLMGAPDRAPLWAAGQARHLTGFWAAVGALAALHQRRLTGRGVIVDLSQQEAVVAETGSGWLFAAYADQAVRRQGAQTHFVFPCPIVRCRDGYLLVMVVVRKQWIALAGWLAEEGAADGLDDPKYNDITVRMADRDHVNATIARWAADRSNRALFLEGQRRGIPFAVVQTIDKVLADPHLAARDFWRSVTVEGVADPIRAPGAHFRTSPPRPLSGAERGKVSALVSPSISDVGTAIFSVAESAALSDTPATADAPSPFPLPRGEGEGGLPPREEGDVEGEATRGEGEATRGEGEAAGPLIDEEAPVGSHNDTPRRAGEGPGVRSPLAGIRVLDFTWVLAGPFGSRVLADLGADVIKVEPRGAGDGARWNPPFAGGERGLNRGGLFNDLNHGKRDLSIDLKDPRGLAIARRLATEWADVLIENFAPGTLERIGLDPVDLTVAHPRLIVLRLSAFGQTGPYRDLIGYAPPLQALAGLTALTGYPPDDVMGISLALGDYVGGLTGVLVGLAALLGREGSGHGAIVDISQFEGAVRLLGPGLLDFAANGRVQSLTGNLDPWGQHAPHGVYPAGGPGSIDRVGPAGEDGPAQQPGSVPGSDRWIALAVTSDADWQALRRALGNPMWARDPDLATAAGRIARADRIDAHLTEWTRRHSAEDAVEALQTAGVSAAMVQDSFDLLRRDPRLAARGYFQTIDHPECGMVTTTRLPLVVDGAHLTPRRPAPLLGEHNEEILRDLLGLSEPEIDDLILSEVI